MHGRNFLVSEQRKGEMVRATPLAVELTDEQCEVLESIVTSRTLGDGETLIREGNIDNSLHVIVSGMLAVVKDTGGGDIVTLHILKAGDLAGELGFMDGMEHSATLRAMGEAEVFSLEREAFESLLPDHPTLVYRVMRAIIRQVHSIVRRMNTQYVELTNYITKQHGRY
jgi:CRP/FNR family transcriptional regulator, cyclic AMP receptor protein